MLSGILTLSLIARLVTIAAPYQIWWDGAIYVGMGKTMFSSGALGLWEPFRPVVWPFILGFFWKIGLDPYMTGILLVLASSIGAIYFAYRIGEQLRPGSGIYAATLFSFTPVFIGFTNIPLTDIPALFLGLLGIFFFLKEKLALSGFFLSLGFLFRFPQALLFVSTMIVASILFAQDRRLKPLIMLVAGFAPLTAAYLAFNFFLYHDPLYALRVGSFVASQSVGLYDKNPFFYLVSTLGQNPLLIFFAVFGYRWIRTFQILRKNPAALLILISPIILLGYFSLFPHKELRYALAFIPYFAIGAGYGIHAVVERVSRRPQTRLIAAGLLSVLLIILLFSLTSQPWQDGKTPEERAAFYAYFADKPGTRVITSSPQLIVLSDIKIVGLDDTWEGIQDEFLSASRTPYIALDTCQIICQTPRCQEARENIFQNTSERYTTVFDRTDSRCRYIIFKAIQ